MADSLPLESNVDAADRVFADLIIEQQAKLVTWLSSQTRAHPNSVGTLQIPTRIFKDDAEPSLELKPKIAPLLSWLLQPGR